MHSDRTPATATLSRHLSRTALALAALAVAGCGSTYRPVVSSINPVGPAGQPTKYAVAISSNGTSAQGLVTLIDFSGDTILNTTLIGVNPQYFILASTGFEGYTLNGDGTLTSFAISSSLLASQVLETTLLPNSNPQSLYSQGNYLYAAEGSRATPWPCSPGCPPPCSRRFPRAPTPSTSSAPMTRHAPSPSCREPAPTARSCPSIPPTTPPAAPLPVGSTPVYGVMTADSRRAFILNKGSNNVTVINSQTNALDTFTVNGTVTSTIPVGVAPVWADFAPTLSELLVANAGNGTTPGSVTVVNIPVCNAVTLPTNPNCDPANPVDAAGFGSVLANIPVGVNPVMIAVLQDGSQAFVANAGNVKAGIAGSVSIINLTTNTVVATLPAAVSSNQADSLVHGHPNFIAVTTGTPTGKAYVTAADSTDITVIRSDIDAVSTHLPLQGNGVAVRMNQQ